ncbi:MAG: HlyC/CorC family transporter [Chloroflexi bacterium]|nr:HlyC/CorC family transporter [Chloroflexota bacterium]
MDPDSTFYGVMLAVALAALWFAATAESALSSLSRARYQRLVEQGTIQAQALVDFFDRPSVFLATATLLKLVALAAAVSVGTLLITELALPSTGALAWAAGLSLLVTLLGHVLPRAVAVSRPERVSLALALPLRIVSFPVAPVVRALGIATVWLSSLLGRSGVADGPLMTPDELRVAAAESAEEGLIEENEREMIDGILDLEATAVREIMVPRLDVVALPADLPIAAAIDVVVGECYSRLPVYEQTRVHIVGILYAKDIFPLVRANRLQEPVGALVRPAYFIPEMKKVDDLLRELQQKKVHIAVVVDEYGGTAGMVTIEDLIEEIVGEIQDEYDAEEAKFVAGRDGEAVFNATVSIDDVNDQLGLHLEGEDVDTIGGLVYERLGKVPLAGDSVTADGAMITVVSTLGRRIKRVRVARLGEPGDADRGQEHSRV